MCPRWCSRLGRRCWRPSGRSSAAAVSPRRTGPRTGTGRGSPGLTGEDAREVVGATKASAARPLRVSGSEYLLRMEDTACRMTSLTITPVESRRTAGVTPEETPVRPEASSGAGSPKSGVAFFSRPFQRSEENQTFPAAPTPPQRGRRHRLRSIPGFVDPQNKRSAGKSFLYPLSIEVDQFPPPQESLLIRNE